MTQNIYDNNDFFRQYSRIDRSLHGLAGAPEWPSLRRMLPDLRGAKILDLGCGFGWFSRWAREQNAQSVLAVDVSENMLKKAIDMTSDDGVVFERLDLEEVEFPQEQFDLVFSSLALHYVENLAHAFNVVYRALVSGGSFIFSTEHPIYTAPRHPQWFIQNDGYRTWPVDQYLAEGFRVTDWLTEEVVKQHRTIGTTVNLLVRAGFTLTHLEEWGPDDDQVAAHPEWSEHRDRPMFLLISARTQKCSETTTLNA
jgi:ubiquinone/menaquinone biosynthesis C-methylase UbiE